MSLVATWLGRSPLPCRFLRRRRCFSLISKAACILAETAVLIQPKLAVHSPSAILLLLLLANFFLHIALISPPMWLVLRCFGASPSPLGLSQGYWMDSVSLKRLLGDITMQSSLYVSQQPIGWYLPHPLGFLLIFTVASLSFFLQPSISSFRSSLLLSRDLTGSQRVGWGRALSGIYSIIHFSGFCFLSAEV